MEVVCESSTPESPPIKKRKVKNKLSRKPCKYMVSGATPIASGRICSCCEDLWCTPAPAQPCGCVPTPEEIRLPTSEGCSFLDENRDHDKTEIPCGRVGGICPGNLSCTSSVVTPEDHKPCYSEKEIRVFVEIIKNRLLHSLEIVGNPSVCGSNFRACETPQNYCEGFAKNNVRGVSFSENVSRASSHPSNESSILQCNCLKEEICGAQKVGEVVPQPPDPGVQNICGFHKPIILRHEKRYQQYQHAVEDFEPRSKKPGFGIGRVTSSIPCKWGELDVVDRLLAERNTGSFGQSKQSESHDFCKKKDKFDELARFSCLDKKCCATLCRQSFRWTYRLSKRWKILTRRPHVVIHLPSMGYPSEIRCRALGTFDFLQNLQVTRLGWLANENAQVVYIFPSNQSLEMVTLLEDLIKNVRPDVTKKRLWIIQLDGEKSLKTDCLNGSQALFISSNAYRRVKMLTAGRQAFLLPGVMEEIDALIASELRTPIMGPSFMFQNYFLNKSNVAKFLQEINVDQPPFVPDVRNFAELCQALARLMIKFPNYVTWLMKINYGFNGLQTASFSFEKNAMRKIINAKTGKKSLLKTNEEELTVFLMEVLPAETIFNKKAYKTHKEFCCDLEKYGGLVQACPYADYEVLSLGVFVEHDTAEPLVCASADVFHVPNDLTTDLGYGISAAKMARLPLKNLAVTVGIALREYQYIGYFGMDVVTLTNEDAVEKFFVVDIDPHYTDVIAFTDWVRFCLGHGSPPQFSNSGVPDDGSNTDVRKRESNSSKIVSPERTEDWYAVCSGKLYSDGLSKYCGSTIVTLCEERNVRYNAKIKQGSMICPLDSERRAFGLVSLYPNRSWAVYEFAKGLRVLHELSLEKHNEIKTNMLKFARALERREQRRNGNRKRNEGST